MDKKEKKIILVIEDEEVMRNLITDILEKNGYSVVCCADGSDGIREFKKGQFDVVITDMVMPKVDGMETIIMLKKIDPDVQIVAVSGASNKESLLRAADIFEACIALGKPFTKEDILSAVKHALNHGVKSV